MLIDNHCHIYPSEVKNANAIIESCKKENIYMILNGICKKSNLEIIELSKKYDNVFASIGYDHSVVNKITDEDIDLLEEQIKNNDITAIGEIGLDYYWVKNNKNKQKDLFKKMLNLAEKYKLPVIVHARDAEEDVYDILKGYKLKGLMHCYQGSTSLAKKFINLGYYIGIDGPITYKDNKLKDLVKEIGIENILIETDSPYLSPNPKRGEKNTSLNLIYIAKEISKILDLSLDETIEKLNNNSIKLFNIGV